MTETGALLSATAHAQSILRELVREVGEQAQLMVRELDTTGGRLDPLQAREIVELRRRIEEEVARRLPAALAEMREGLPAIVEEIAHSYPALGDALSGRGLAAAGGGAHVSVAPQIVEDLVRFLAEEEVAVARIISGQASANIAAAVRRAVSTGAKIETMAADVATAMETTFQRAATAVDRTIREFHEVAIKRTGERAADILDDEVMYIYAGPVDAILRTPYCAARVGRVLTQAQAEALDPHERYNCRHSLIPVTRSEAAGMRAFPSGIIKKSRRV